MIPYVVQRHGLYLLQLALFASIRNMAAIKHTLERRLGMKLLR